MTYAKRYRLRIDMVDWHHNTGYAEYDNFRVGSEREKYKLISLGKYMGNAGQWVIANRMFF